jgi:hypothetical protein
LNEPGPQLQDAVQSALAMAQAGKDALDNAVDIKDSQSNNNVPRDPELRNLIQNLFAHQKHIDGTMPEVPRPNSFNYKVTLDNMKLRNVYSELRTSSIVLR